MSDAVVIRNLSKRYKLFQSKTAKILDLFGVSVPGKYEEFWALRDVNLSIKKGEKVGFVGRNGAGKTTLLSIIAGTNTPTGGSVLVKGKVDALFTLGTGFHPEFSGRENIIASLSFQGITGKEARSLMGEIIEFTELEDFMDQPVKTYSAGMYARLAFTVSTSIRPDILIIDEILGAGDAYFASKALERMKELTLGGTTVLFVSHDLASVQKICDRCVWIDKGKVAADRDSLSVIKLYAADVRHREEARLRAKSAGILKKDSSTVEVSRQVIFRLIGCDASAPREGLPVHRITVYLGDKRLSEINVGDSMDNSPNEDAFVLIDKGTINWGEPVKIEGKWAREFKDLGGKYVHAAGIFKLPDEAALGSLCFEVEYMDRACGKINFDIYVDGKGAYRTVKTLVPAGTNTWVKESFPFSEAAEKGAELSTVPVEGSFEAGDDHDVYGIGKVAVTKVVFRDDEGTGRFTFEEGERVSLELGIKINDRLGEFPYAGYSMYDERGNLVSNFFEQVGIRNEGEYTLSIKMRNSGLLKKGRYLFSLAIYKEIDILDVSKPWPAYIVLDRKTEMVVTGRAHTAVPMGILDMKNEIEIL